MENHFCTLPSLTNVENSYLQCYLSKMSSFTEYYIRHQILPDPMESYARNSSEFFLAVRSAASVGDCVNPLSPLDITKRTRYVWNGISVECMANVLGISNSTDMTEYLVESICPPQYCLGKKGFLLYHFFKIV